MTHTESVKLAEEVWNGRAISADLPHIIDRIAVALREADRQARLDCIGIAKRQYYLGSVSDIIARDIRESMDQIA